MHRWESYLSSRRRPPSFYFLLFNAAWLLAGICFSSTNRWESATGSSLSPQRTYRDNGLILRSRNGAVVIRLCDWFVRDDGFREKRQSKCREWHTLLYSAMYRQKSMFFFCLFASNSDDARLPFQEDDNSRVESLSTLFRAINVNVISSELIVVRNFVCIYTVDDMHNYYIIRSRVSAHFFSFDVCHPSRRVVDANIVFTNKVMLITS